MLDNFGVTEATWRDAIKGGTRPDCWTYLVEIQDPGLPATEAGYR